jgi:flagellar hook-associated protein 3 FlgL
MQMDYLIQGLTGHLNQLAAEVSSGVKTNPAASMGTSAALLYQLNTQSDQETVLQTTIATASSNLDAVQNVMTSISSIAQAASADGAAAQTTGTSTVSSSAVSLLAGQAQNALQQVLGQLNTAYTGSALFAGNSTVPPMDSSTAPMAALNGLLATAAGTTPLSASGVSSFISGALTSAFGAADPATNTATNPNFSLFYGGTTDNTGTSALIGATQTLQYNTSANQQPFRDLIQGLSMLGMASSSNLDSTGASQMVTRGMQMISSAQTELTGLQGSLGNVQSQMTGAVSLQTSAAQATQLQIANYTNADTTVDATEVTSLQTQLEASYQLTSMISQLSLTHYMPAAA